MANKRCPVCGQRYSDTYQTCPFCQEEAALREGRRIRREQLRKKRERRARICRLMIAVGILALLGVGILLYRALSAEDGAQQTPDDPALEELQPGGEEAAPPEELPEEPEGSGHEGEMPDGPGHEGQMPDGPAPEEEDLPHGVMPEAPVAAS